MTTQVQAQPQHPENQRVVKDKLLKTSTDYFNEVQKTTFTLSTQKFVPYIIADLHISDKASKTHVDYFRDCVEHLTEITSNILKLGVTHVILLGDLIGRTTERNLESREVLAYMMKVLQTWNAMTNGNVYSVRGNHDYNTRLTDFEIFVSLGLVKTPEQLDIGSVRFHLVNYGELDRKLDIHPEFYNVALTHSEIHIAGVTSWFMRSQEAVDLETLDNFYGIDLVLGGHIHNPSPKMVHTNIKDKEVALMYLGCALFTSYESKPWSTAYGVYFTTDEETVELNKVEYKLRPAEELFLPRKTNSNEEEDEDEDDLGENGRPILDVEQLSTILGELTQYNMMGETDFKTQIQRLETVDKAGVTLALEYITQIESEFKKG